MVDFVEIEGPDWFACYLINDDATYLSDEEEAQINAWLEREGILRVVAIKTDEETGEFEEPRFTWAYRLYFPESGCDGGSVVTYICEMKGK